MKSCLSVNYIGSFIGSFIGSLLLIITLFFYRHKRKHKVILSKIIKPGNLTEQLHFRICVISCIYPYIIRHLFDIGLILRILSSNPNIIPAISFVLKN